MAGSASRDLTRAEQSYAAQVKYQLRHVPGPRQTAMLQTVRRALLSGTPTDTYGRIERELGTPADYAARLQSKGESAEATAVRERPAAAKAGGSAVGAGVAVAVLLVIAVIVVVVLATR